ncbi:ribonuclease Z [Encephalitozoon romaleae SJ-2008]|uniref:ribonuclease Z n=1 Tax=Encephalitozoon romaleae (strain SJ-2008) TaxID=1178016 RepID=I6ZU11_ENCRO|nr:ribonuclease Z [Encephalitozoon romaleae SJ-2008]AFN83131.1 ribonuclease Z [Encephalitozoon romaleae SJ-2008]
MIEFKYLATRSGKSLVLTIDNKRYLFNLFEGFQRYCIESSVSISKISTIFVSSEESVPPLIGMYLTLRDVKKKALDIVCSPRIQEMIILAKRFADPMSLRINYMRDYADEFIRVEAIESMPSIEADGKKEFSFILKIKPIRGRFLVEKVPEDIPKHLYSRLTKRESIEYNGKVYDGREYMEDDVDIGTIAIVYSSGNFERLLERIREEAPKYFFCFQRDVAQHLSSVFDGHFFFLEDNHFVEYLSLYNIQLELSSIHKDFLLPLPSENLTYPLKLIESIQSCGTLIYTKSTKCFSHLPSSQKEHTSCSREHKEKAILFLGTGCAIPSKYRNVSSILYESHDAAIMLDCGEDTLFQIHRAYGGFNVLKKLKAIFVSHSHADHVLGITSALKKISHKIKIFAPAAIKPFVKSFDIGNHEYIETNHAKAMERKFQDIWKLSQRSPLCTVDVEDHILKFDVGFEVGICGVDHCSDSCGIRVKDGDTIITYSGDARPSILFGMMSLDSDVMIHEATFALDQEERAMHTGHSTIDGALKVFKASKSKVLLLTHFSQRYSKGIISDGQWIPCIDLFRYTIGSTLYPTDEINAYYDKLKLAENR